MINRVLITASLLLIMAGCGGNVDLTVETTKLMEVDRQFSTMSVEQGATEAFMHYAADSAVIYREGSNPISGKDAIRARLEHEAGGTLSWEPSFARVSASADLGYTLGSWEYSLIDSLGIEQTANGYYVTIWKKTPEGEWRWVFDGGVAGPEPPTP